jgi:hypothetical protein
MQTQQKHQQRYPNFLYVGAGKSGSTWIFEILREHPDVFVPVSKDIMFFDKYYHLGMGWYLDQFSGISNEKAVGELTHDYFLSDGTARRIHQDLPGVKIMFCLREGVDRTFSEYLYDQTLFQYVPHDMYKQGLNFEEYASLPETENRSDYYNNMKPFFNLFPREDILVLFMDALRKEPKKFAEQIFKFLEVDTDFLPPSLHRHFNVARHARITIFANLAYSIGGLLRRSGTPSIVGAVKRQTWFERLLYRSYDNEKRKPEVSQEVIQRLRIRYHKDYDKLSHLIGKPLPDEWFKFKNE